MEITSRLHCTMSQQHGLARDVRSVAVHGDRLVLIGEGDLLQVISGVQTASPSVLSAHHLGWQPGNLLLSPSHQFALVWDQEGKQMVVRDLLSGSVQARFGDEAINYPKSVVATILRAEGKETLLVSHRMKAELEAYDLRDMRLIFQADCHKPRPFYFSHLYPAIRGSDIFFGLGSFVGEMMDTLIALSVQRFLSDNQALHSAFKQPHRIYDYADRLAVGPCGTDHVVVFRDADGYEDPDEEEGELWNFRGLYIRRVTDGRLIERILYDAPIETGAPLFATRLAVVVVCPDHLEVVPRSGIHAGMTAVPGTAFGVDPEHRRVAAVAPTGEVKIIEILD